MENCQKSKLKRFDFEQNVRIQQRNGKNKLELIKKDFRFFNHFGIEQQSGNS
jgi:hypothetical protein